MRRDTPPPPTPLGKNYRLPNVKTTAAPLICIDCLKTANPRPNGIGLHACPIYNKYDQKVLRDGNNHITWKFIVYKT